MANDPLSRFRPRVESVEVAGRSIELLVLDDDAVLDVLSSSPVAAGAPAPDNPYFGLLWESAIVLARRVASGDPLAGARVLDLGCGVGLSGIVAALSGGRVTFADVMPQAIELSRRNAKRAGVTGEFVRFDLRAPAALAGRRFDRVLASDVLYERGKPAAILAALDAMLADDGRALLSDPMRPTADGFAREAEAAGFAVATTTEPIATAKATLLVRSFELTRKRAAR